MNRAFVIAGPTASGKTDLSIALARRLGGEIVSADSMQVYRGMDIGTAKVTPEEMQSVPHHMIDVASPSENYSAARYVDEASVCCDAILQRGNIPVITGGTGLYIDSLISGRSFAENSDGSVRAELDEEYGRVGGAEMLEKLRLIDPDRAEMLSPGDRRRIVRAIEIFRLTGVTATEHDRLTRLLPPRYDAVRIVLAWPDREELYRRINLRVDLMVEQGLFGEVEALLASGIPADCTAMQAIGYKEAAAALRGEMSRDEAVEMIKMNSRRYAKRQVTWFSRWENAFVINRCAVPDTDGAIAELAAKGVL